jgi:hypothetical protein
VNGGEPELTDIGTGPRGRGRLRLGPLTVMVVALVGATYCILHSWRHETRFQFLSGARRLFATDPGVPGFVQTVYVARRPLKDVANAAEKEATALGYQGKWSKDGRYFILVGAGPDHVSVDLSAGRATGKHWVVDGDFVDGDSDPQWTTIEVSEVDTMPMWLRNVVSWPGLLFSA